MKKFLTLCLLLAGMITLMACGGAQKPAEPVTYSSPAGWDITYNPATMEMNEQDEVVSFVYAGKDKDAGLISIHYVDGKMPQEALYEEIDGIDDSRVTRSEGVFGDTGAWAFTYSVAPTQEEPYIRQFTGIEHNGGTLLIAITVKEGDEAAMMPVSDAIEGVVDSLVFTAHDPQQQFAYVPGTYQRTYTEEMEGQDMTITDTIVLNEDHTGTLDFQDTIPITWSSIYLIDNNNSQQYEYTIEGDNLLVDQFNDGNWYTYERVAPEGDLVGTDFAEYAGTYTSENGDTLTLDAQGKVQISIIRLTQMDGNATGIYKGLIPMTVTDANGKPMGLEFNTETKELTVTDSTWDLLKNGDSFLLDK